MLVVVRILVVGRIAQLVSTRLKAVVAARRQVHALRVDLFQLVDQIQLVAVRTFRRVVCQLFCLL